MSRSEPFGFCPARSAGAPGPRLEPSSAIPGRVVAAGRVLDRHRQHLARLARARERRGGVLDVTIDLAADETQPLVRQQGPGEQAGLAQDLEAVADPEHQATVRARTRATDSITGANRAIAPARR